MMLSCLVVALQNIVLIKRANTHLNNTNNVIKVITSPIALLTFVS